MRFSEIQENHCYLGQDGRELRIASKNHDSVVWEEDTRWGIMMKDPFLRWVKQEVSPVRKDIDLDNLK